MTIQTVDFIALESDLNGAISALEAHGLKPSKGRISVYRKALQELAGARRTGSWDALRLGFPEAVTTLYEVMDLIYICGAPGLSDSPRFFELCDKVLKGPEDYTAENPASASNVARNIAFQLLIAAKMRQGGIPTVLEEDGDVVVESNRRACIIEAKRIQSERKLEKRCNEARKQLTSTLREFRHRWSSGIVAIDITKLVNESFDLLVKESERELKQTLAGLTPGFFQQYSQIWADWDHPKIGGILVHASIMATIEDQNLMVHCREFGLRALDSCDERTSRAIERLATILDASRVLLDPH